MIPDLSAPLLLAMTIGAAGFPASYALGRYRALRQAKEAMMVRRTLRSLTRQKERAESHLGSFVAKLSRARDELQALHEETEELQNLKRDAELLERRALLAADELEDLEEQIDRKKGEAQAEEELLHTLLARVDLYSRVDDLIDVGHVATPQYLFETSERYAAEINMVREQQARMIQDNSALIVDGHPVITGDTALDRRITDGQLKLALKAFNLECDLLIGKVAPGNLERTLGQIERVANDTERLCASLRCGLSTEYVSLKYRECGLQYEHALKARDEQAEQLAVREKMREEARLEREYRDAIAQALREERLTLDQLDTVRSRLAHCSHEERPSLELQQSQLQAQLADIASRSSQARSMAEQSRRGFVYVISNTGSFGEGVYKIGMTRRLDPLERIQELSSASVPFDFDVHALVCAEDASGLEAAIHRQLSEYRINTRKEFFRTDLELIRSTIESLTGNPLEMRHLTRAVSDTSTMRQSKATPPTTNTGRQPTPTEKARAAFWARGQHK